jgi:hypothetical protein
VALPGEAAHRLESRSITSFELHQFAERIGNAVCLCQRVYETATHQNNDSSQHHQEFDRQDMAILYFPICISGEIMAGLSWPLPTSIAPVKQAFGFDGGPSAHVV